jgi:hypothetical protein
MFSKQKMEKFIFNIYILKLNQKSIFSLIQSFESKR